ncbi:MAG TPA: DUF6345 domain-containing protein, partial [Caldilineaceae bacterium]|nr:DUF6345 domain-containing protein [Caldilineaceae bacterium]
MAARLFQQRWKRVLSRALCLGILAGLLLAPALQAAEGVQPDAVTADDGGAWELGVHGTAGNLTAATAAERYGMWYWLNGWFVRRYSFAESTAWEEDFKRASLGGTENFYIDSVDLQFYVGHGAPGLFTFDNASHDDGTLNASTDCDTTWGDGDNEWLALTSCQVLSSTNNGLARMAQCMNRQHLILGFVTNASAHNNYWDTQAYHFGRYLRYGYSLTQAWFNACDVADRGRITRVIAEETACFNDNPYYSSVCADVYDSDYYWYTHSCGTSMAAAVPLDLTQGDIQVPVYKIDPYSTAEFQDYVGRLGRAFFITPTVQTASVGEDVNPPDPLDDSSFLVSSDISRTLTVNSDTGLYYYADLGQLWTADMAQQALAARASEANVLTQDDLKRIADNFLNSNGLMPPDAQFDSIEQDTTGSLGRGASLASAEEIEQAETPALNQVIYTRVLSGVDVNVAGVTQNITFTVVGPGAKQKVVLPVTGQVNAAGELQADPLGAQGGWRRVSQQVRVAEDGSEERVMTTILDAQTAIDLYMALDKEVVLNPIPSDIDLESRQVLSYTLAYYEKGPDSAQSGQGELIPVYQLLVKFQFDNNGVPTDDQDYFFVPASPQYLNPIARILNPPAQIDQSENVTLTAADASQTLAALGLGSNFNFVAGYNGADGTYTYEWYLDTVAPENKITDLNDDNDARIITFNP